MIKAEIIADSVNPKGARLTTFLVRIARPILAELNTHRSMSRNSASSRALPFKKMLDMVEKDPFIPIRFQKDHKGMQGTEYFEGEDHEACVCDWLRARDSAVKAATSFSLPVTKQLRNRLLEPFMWHTVILSATDFENFFALRAHVDAEIHMQKLAELMLEEYNKSVPNELKEGEWHIPFGDSFDNERLENLGALVFGESFDSNRYQLIDELKRKIAVARIARLSYYNFEGKDDYGADLKLCDGLFGSVPRHLSPTEHVAQATGGSEFIGNFKGFKQYRKFFKDENLSDPRVLAWPLKS